MRTSDRLQIIVHILNFVIFLYFAIVLISMNPLDVLSVVISFLGIFASIVVGIIGAVERLRE